jgi:hypothetical protein
VTSARAVYDCKAYMLTMLHVLTGTLDLSVHEARMFALASIREAPADRYRRYVHLIRIFTPRHARKKLEQLMEDLFSECTDPDLLERWATRAATCSTIDEVFAS